MRRRALGAAVAVVIGWASGLAALVAIAQAFHPPSPWSTRLTEVVIAGAAMWLFILPVWLLVFLPLYCLLPRRSPLWRWPIATFLGCVAGAVVIYAYAALTTPAAQVGLLPAIAAIVGGVTSLTASLTEGRFDGRDMR